MRTYSQADWQDALQAWTEGEFSDEWRDIRHTMAMQGCIYPPNGSRWDSWDDDAPSQRAVLIRAIRETPTLLAVCVKGARTWSVVIDRLLRARDDWRADQRADEGDDEDRPIDRAAPQRIAAILQRITDSGWTSPEEGREQERLDRMAEDQEAAG